jgi:hydrogenase expression/formation protein HypC
MTGEPAARRDCGGDHCVTCGDVAVQVKIVRLLPDELAIVDTGRGGVLAEGTVLAEGGVLAAGREIVSVALVSAVAGDTILVHAGEAIAIVGEVIR